MADGGPGLRFEWEVRKLCGAQQKYKDPDTAIRVDAVCAAVNKSKQKGCKEEWNTGVCSHNDLQRHS